MIDCIELKLGIVRHNVVQSVLMGTQAILTIQSYCWTSNLKVEMYLFVALTHLSLASGKQTFNC